VADIIQDILTVAAFILTPAVIIHLNGKSRILRKVDIVLILYVLGVVFGNICHPPHMHEIQEALSSAVIPAAIPLMLFSCSFKRSRTRSRILAMLTGLLAVATAVTAGYLLLGARIEDGAKIGGMLAGVYTGGTMNLAALKVMLGVSDTTYVLINAYDIVICFFYLSFVLAFGYRLFRHFLPKGSREESDGADSCRQEMAKPYRELFTRRGLKDAAILLGIDAAVILASLGLASIAGEEWFMTVLIISLTSMGIAGSFVRKIREKKNSYDIGMYLIYIFSMSVASLADFSEFNSAENLTLAAYMMLVIFGSLLIQFILARLFRIDADIMTVASVAYICSPPFVPMVAGAMKNRDVLAPGMAIGVVGYAAGNYLGFIMASLLSFL